MGSLQSPLLSWTHVGKGVPLENGGAGCSWRAAGAVASLFADRNFSSLPLKSSSKHAQPCFPEADNLTKSVLISTRNAPTLPNFKSLFQSVEAPEVLKQRDVRKKKYIGKAAIFPQPSAETWENEKKKKEEKVQAEAE